MGEHVTNRSMTGPASSTDGEPLLAVRDLVKRFGGVLAVDHVSIEISASEVLGIIGPNGAGKSTLLKLIAGEIKPDSGEILLDGERTDRLRLHQVARLGVGLAHQIPLPFEKLTVRQNVQVGSLARGLRAVGSSADHVDEVLALTGLDDKASRPAGSLTLLDLKRLELARALALSPSLLLLDEVGAGLVRSELKMMIDLIGNLHRRGITLLIVEHVELVISELASRVIVIDWGRIIKAGAPPDIAVDPEVRALYLGQQDDERARRVRSYAPSGEAPPSTLLALERVDARYGAATALSGIDLTIGSGEVVAVLGANGAGKTTLASVISGAHRASSGRVLFEGNDITRLSAHRRVGLGIAVCHEGRRIFPTLTVEENLNLGAYTRRARDEVAGARREVFELFPLLHERRNQLGRTLSGGQQQMLAIGRALLASPKLLILDEASLGLAPIVVDQIFQAITTISERGIAVLVIEQNVHRSLEVADRVYVLDHGRVSFNGVPDELREEETLWQVYFGGGAVTA